MARLLVPRRPSPVAGAARPVAPILRQAPVNPAVAARLAKRYGVPIEFWLTLGQKRPVIRATGPASSLRQRLILPGDKIPPKR